MKVNKKNMIINILNYNDKETLECEKVYINNKTSGDAMILENHEDILFSLSASSIVIDNKRTIDVEDGVIEVCNGEVNLIY